MQAWVSNGISPGCIYFLRDDPQFAALQMAAPFTTPKLSLPFTAPELSLPFTSPQLSLPFTAPELSLAVVDITHRAVLEQSLRSLGAVLEQP